MEGRKEILGGRTYRAIASHNLRITSMMASI